MLEDHLRELQRVVAHGGSAVEIDEAWSSLPPKSDAAAGAPARNGD
jgi:hypothetical protein